jgi:hypothetical protein
MIDPILDSGVAFLLDHDVSDWYVFMNVDGLTRQDAANIEALLAQNGEKSEYSVSELSAHLKKAFMSSGTIHQIMDGLDALGETQRELRAEYIRTKAQFN